MSHMRPHIQFCRSRDGLSLATASYGSGPPLVRAATWLTHVEMDAESPHQAGWIEALSRQNTYITYDMRGCGLSSRSAGSMSIEAWVEDLENVVDAMQLERFPLFGISQGAAIAVEYAAKHPERVSRLILYGGVAASYGSQGAPAEVRKEGEALLQLAEVGWERASPAFRRVWVERFFPGAPRELQAAFDKYCRLSAGKDVALRCFSVMHSLDVRASATRVTCPTLVMHARRDQMVPFIQGRCLASLIPNATLIPIDSGNHSPLPGEACWPRIADEMQSFLGNSSPRSSLTSRQVEVLRMVLDGKSDKEIARALDLSPRTVEMHVRSSLRALGCDTRVAAAQTALSAGLLR